MGRKVNSTQHSTFDELLRYMGTLGNPPRETDIHFSRITDLCLPCEIDYDYIVHMETLHQDAAYIFRDVIKTRLMNPLNFILKQVGPSTKRAGHNSTESVLEEFYKHVTPAAKQAIYQYLATDALLFGYDPNGPL